MRCQPFLRAAAVGTAALLALVGCVQRTINITSAPSGALVYLNDQEVGRTPVTVPFTFYGVYDVRLEHDGYAPLHTSQEAQAPWWETPGPDLVAEAIPHNKTQQQWHFDLKPAEPVHEDELIQRADELRQQATGQPATESAAAK